MSGACVTTGNNTFSNASDLGSNGVKWPTNVAAGTGGNSSFLLDHEIDSTLCESARTKGAFGDMDNLGIGSSGKSLCSVITVKPSTVPAGWLRSRCQITNIGENRRDRFPVQSKQAEHKVTNFADAASPCHQRAANSLDGEEVSGQYNERLNKLNWQFEKALLSYTVRFDLFPIVNETFQRSIYFQTIKVQATAKRDYFSA